MGDHAWLSPTRKILGVVMLLVAAVLLGIYEPAGAAELRGATVAPNWALGSPQPVFISGCGDAIGFVCLGHFGLGALSDVLDIGLLGRSVVTEASLSENQRFVVFGRLETGNETIFDWWNLWIPNARWIGFGPNAGIGFFMHDAGDVPAWTAKAFNYACFDRIDPTAHHDDGNRLGRTHGRLDGYTPSCYHDDINLQTHQLGSKLRIPILLPLRISVLGGNVLSFYVAKLAQS